MAAANCVNIPLMRQNEIVKGIDVLDENGNKIGVSKVFTLYYVNGGFLKAQNNYRYYQLVLFEKLETIFDNTSDLFIRLQVILIFR